MADKPNLARRWQDLQASKTQLFWACAVCVGATMIGGFTWGGWVTGGTAKEMVSTAAIGARAEMAAAICVERFANGPDAKAKLASLKGAASYLRNDMIEKDGWVTLTGAEKPIAGAAVLCVRQLMDETPKAAKTSS
jgi:hypothetical protein